MFPALLTALFFAASGICGQRAAVHFGSLRANALRLMLAAFALGLLVWVIGPVNFRSHSVRLLLYSGIVGFGIGDIGLYTAYPRLGSRLTLLIYLCGAPLCGALGDWCFTGTTITPSQMAAGMMILAGVSLALSRGVRLPSYDARNFIPGVTAAGVAGFCQGFGAALSRLSKAVGVKENVHLTSISEAFVRIIPGVSFGVIAWIVTLLWMRRRQPVERSIATASRSRWSWLIGAALFGPVLGVSCFQWALSSASSAVVLSMTAATPILVMPLAIYIEKDKPGWIALLGAFIAMTGVIGMILLH